MNNFEPRILILKTGEEVLITPLNADDFPAFEAYRNIFVTETTHTYQTAEVPLDREKITSRWKKMESGNTDFIFKVEDSKGNMISTFGFHINMRHHPWVKHVAEFGMGILKSHWGTGLAVELMTFMETVAKSEGITRMEGLVRCNNERGVALYKKMNYEIEGTRKNAAFIDGEYRDEYYIAKML